MDKLPTMKKLTLHEAMEQVLLANGKRMRVEDLATEIARRDLYRRQDGAHAPAKQLYSRASNHTKFQIEDGEIWLR